MPYSNGYNNRWLITIDRNKVGGSLTDFPIIFENTDVQLKSVANGGQINSSSAWDVRFEALDGSKLSHEIVYFDAVNGILECAVKIPALDNVSDTNIYIYFGKSGLVASEENVADVWSNSFARVFHMRDITTSTIKDSVTGNTFSKSAANKPAQINAQYSVGEDFNGSDAYINTGANSAFIPGVGTNDVSVAALFKHPDFNDDLTYNNQKTIFSCEGALPNIYLTLRQNNYHFRYIDNGTNAQQDRTGLLPQLPNEWVYLVGRITGQNVTLSGNGGLNTSSVQTLPDAKRDLPSGSNSSIGGTSAFSSRNFKGQIKRLTVSTVSRSTAWEKTEYNNQLNPNVFYVINKAPGFQNGYAHRRLITVDKSKVPGVTSHSKFTMLFTITDPEFKSTDNGGTVRSNSGWDIRFEDASGNKLFHDLARYDPTTGSLIAWILLPTINGASAASNTQFYVYYGKQGLPRTESEPVKAYDDSYVLVSHMSGATITDVKKGNIFTKSNNVTEVDAFIGKGQQFAMADNASFSAPDAPELDIQGSMNIDVWIKPSAWKDTAADSGGIIWKNTEYGVRTQDPGGGNGQVVGFIYDTTLANYRNVSFTITTGLNQWYLVSFRKAGGAITIYVNGVVGGSRSDIATVAGTTSSLLIGHQDTSRSFDGVIDEVRIRKSVPSTAQWYVAEYNNQSSPSTFYTVGREENNFVGNFLVFF